MQALVAILNAIYESGYIVDCSKKEFMQRMATMLGCPGIADYNKALYNVKNTYQYDEEIFTDLAQVAHNEILKKRIKNRGVPGEYPIYIRK